MSKHTEAAKSFLKMAGMGKVQDGYDQYIAPSFVHHNQYFKGDRQSLLNAMQEASETTPNKSIEIKHAYEDGNTVITHSLVTRQRRASTGGRGGAHFPVRTGSHRGAMGCGADDPERFAE